MVNPIYICGSDGSGKTTYLKKIEYHFKQNGIKTHHIWLRSPKILSKPLMVYCRLVGLTKYNTVNGVRYGTHEFYRSQIVSILFPIIQLIDFKIYWYFLRYKIRNSSIMLFDRFALDTLADLMVDTHRFNLHKTKIGKKFIDCIPLETKIILLQVGENIVRSRKLDTRYDPNLSTKIKVYDILAQDLSLSVIKNETSQDIVFKKIIEKLEL